MLKPKLILGLNLDQWNTLKTAIEMDSVEKHVLTPKEWVIGKRREVEENPELEPQLTPEQWDYLVNSAMFPQHVMEKLERPAFSWVILKQDDALIAFEKFEMEKDPIGYQKKLRKEEARKHPVRIANRIKELELLLDFDESGEIAAEHSMLLAIEQELDEEDEEFKI